MSVTTAKWTLEDYHRMIEVGILSDRRVELLNGDIVDMAPESPEHAYLGTENRDYLNNLLKGQAQVRDGHPITLPNDSEPEPDLAIVRPLGQTYRTRHPYPENIFWLIEYAKTSLNKDLEMKRQIYAAAGIQEYWVLHLKNRVVIVFREPEGDDYRFQETLRNGEIRPLAFSEIRVSVQRLLEGI